MIKALYLRLSNNELVAPKQAIDKLTALPEYITIKNQLHEVAIKYGKAGIEKTINGVNVEAIRIPHVCWPARTEIENLVYRVTLDHLTVMHLGDADKSSKHYQQYNEFLSKKLSHHSFVPGVFAVNMSLDKENRSMFNASHITYIHIPTKVPEKLKALKLDLLLTHGDVREIKAVSTIGANTVNITSKVLLKAANKQS